VVERIGVIFQRWGGPQFLVSLCEPGFWIARVTHFEAVPVVKQEICALVRSSEVATRIKEASPSYLHAAWEGDGVRISYWDFGGTVWKGIIGREFRPAVSRECPVMGWAGRVWSRQGEADIDDAILGGGEHQR
jgi:hypothetical protein